MDILQNICISVWIVVFSAMILNWIIKREINEKGPLFEFLDEHTLIGDFIYIVVILNFILSVGLLLSFIWGF